MYNRPLRPDELEHFGTRGMMWGRRRYQNPDGSLTPEGREHYGYGNKRDLGENNQTKESKGSNHGKKRGAMTIDEYYDNLRTVNQRLTLEQQNKKLMDWKKEQITGPSKAKQTQETANAVTTATNTITNALREPASKANKKAQKKYMDHVSRSLRNMSDEDMRKIVNRKRLEQDYANVVIGSPQIESGYDKAMKVLAIVGGVASTAAAVAMVADTVSKHKNG